MNGIVNILKPSGLSCSDVVSRMRRILHEKHVGHLGTLDPAAAGVLPVLAGKAARLFDVLSVHTKTYRAEFCFGTETDTLDAEGTVVDRRPWDGDLSLLQQILRNYQGEIIQAPPLFSAVKLKGRKAYSFARNRQEVQIPDRKVRVDRLELLRVDGNRLWVEIECGTGTYIRSLCRDIAREAGTCGYLTFLLRTRSGAYTIGDALTLPQAEALASEGRLPFQTMEEAVGFLPKIVLRSGMEKSLINGIRPVLEDNLESGLCRVYCGERFIGLGHEIREEEIHLLKMALYLLPEEEQGALYGYHQ